MKAQNESKTPAVRNKYTAQFKEQALERADKDGIPKAAKDLGLAESMLYNWRAKHRQTGHPFEDQKLQPFTVNGFRPDQWPSTKCLNISKCITIENGFIPN